MEAILVTPSGRLTLGITTLRIGSDASNGLVLADPLVAPVHAEIAPAEDGYQLTDLGSAQGTRMNGQALLPYTPVRLRDDDIITLGTTSLTFLIEESREAPALSSSSTIEELPTDRIPSVSLQGTDEALPSLSGSPQAPASGTPAVEGPLPGAHTADLAGSEDAGTLPQAAAPAFGQAPSPTTPAQGTGSTQQLPPVAPAPLFTPGALPLAPDGQPLPLAIPLQAFAPAGYPVQAAMPSGALPQPGYAVQAGTAPLPGQFQMPTPVEPRPGAQKGRRALLWALLALLGLLILAGSNTATYALAHPATPTPTATPSLPTPKNTLQSYCQGVLAGNAQQIYDLLSAQARVHTSLDDIQQKFSEISLLNSSSGSLNVSYTNCTYDDLRVSGSLAVATVSLTINITMQMKTQEGPTTSSMSETVPSLTSLVWESQRWKIDYSVMTQPQTIFGGNGGLTMPTTIPE